MRFAPDLPSRRTFLRASGAFCISLLAGCKTPVSQPRELVPQRLRLLGEATLPHHLSFGGTTVGGLSAIDFDPASGLWVALSDDRSERQPARFYTLDIQVAEGRLAVNLLDVVTLRQASGQPFPKRNSGGEVVDPEGIRLLPGGRGVLWTSEGDYEANQSPALREARLDGSHVRDFEIPPMLRFASRPGRGPRSNLTFEGLALSPDARTAWVAMEGPLHEDGPVPRVNRPGGPCRFTAFDVASGRAVRQVAYLPDAIPLPPILPGGYAENGVSELLALDADRMLVLERSYSMGAGLSLRVYEIDMRGASDTLALPRLREDHYRPVAKTLVADFSQLGLSVLDNTEGMCWGPRLPNGHRTLVVVSDDNFNPLQVTQFAAFEYLEQT